MRGRKPIPSALTGKRRDREPVPPDALPRCPAHLSAVARREWRRLAKPLYDMGVLTVADRGAFAAYCQAWGRWVEAEEQLKKTPAMVRTPSGHVQQNPWLPVANRQLEIMGRYMAELGLTPAARTRVASINEKETQPVIVFSTFYESPDGTVTDKQHKVVEDGSRRRIVLPPNVGSL